MSGTSRRREKRIAWRKGAPASMSGTSAPIHKIKFFLALVALLCYNMSKQVIYIDEISNSFFKILAYESKTQFEYKQGCK